MGQFICDDCEVIVKSSIVKPVVSAVVAIHNMQRNGYLNELLESFARQTSNKVEYVLVDDASEDRSLSIAREFAEGRSDTTVLHLLENKKQGAARNRGIFVARGMYIAPVDADDYVSDGYFSSIVQAALRTNADVIAPAYFQRVDSKGTIIAEPYRNAPSIEFEGQIDDSFRRILLLNHGQLWCSKRQLFDDVDNYYVEGIAYEDTPALVRWLLQYASLAVAEEACYFYRIHETSTTQTTANSEKLLKDRLHSAKLILANAKGLGLYESYKPEIEECFMRVYLFGTLRMLRGGAQVYCATKHCASCQSTEKIPITRRSMVQTASKRCLRYARHDFLHAPINSFVCFGHCALTDDYVNRGFSDE